MRRLLLVTHRSIDQEGGPAARWRSLARHLPEHGWSVDVLSAPAGPGAVEFAADARSRRLVARRAAAMERVGRVANPALGLAGIRAEALPPSTAWVARGAVGVRRRVTGARPPDVVLATGPPIAALLAARLALGGGCAPPLVLELRDLWAANPAFDAGGRVLGALEARLVAGAGAVVACTPEAADDLRARHPGSATRVHEIPNGYEPELLALRDDDGTPPPPGRRRTILHSGTLVADRPLAPLLRVLARPAYRDRFRLALHGHVAPATRAELAAHGDVHVEVVPPSPWADAVRRIRAADLALVTQAAGAGDATAVASKVYEYLALARPVLAITDGGATEALLRRLGAGALCARLDDDASIAAALDRSQAHTPAPVDPAALARYDRRAIAAEMAALLDALAAGVAPRRRLS